MGKEPSGRRCVFSSGDDAYIPNAVVSLLSFKKHNPLYDMYVLTPSLSAETKALCEAHDVTPIELDLTAEFHTVWDYGRECFYHFKGPEIFASLQYDYSIYLDGDIYCNAPFPELGGLFHIAGVSSDTVREFFIALDEFEHIASRVPLPENHDFSRRRLHSGVLVLNNRVLSELEYFEKVRDLYGRSIACGVPRKGDDSLLALTVAAYPDLQVMMLPRECNLIDFKRFSGEWKSEKPEDDYQCVIYHFGKRKPWIKHQDESDHIDRYFHQKWLEVMVNHLGDDDIQRWYPGFYKERVIEPDRAHFYWYTGQDNFGDWITPYLVKAVSGRVLSAPVDPLTTNEGVVISTGSIMRLCGPNTIVWGSGIRDRYQDISPGRLIRSVRGPITRRRVLEVGGECPPIYGDPALLLPRFYTPKEETSKYHLGIVPHVSQYERVQPLYEDEPGVAVLDIRTQDIESVIDRIAECEAVASSSLHGIVLSNAYQIPVRWIQFDTNLFGDNTKYHDHFASIGRPDETFLDALVYKKLPVPEILDQIEPYEIDIDLDALWDASVFHDGNVAKFIRYVLTEDS